MTKAFQQITELEQEIVILSNALAGVEIAFKHAKTCDESECLILQIKQIRRRRTHAQLEIKAIEAANFAEVSIARRDARYSEIPPKKTKIEFTDGLSKNYLISRLARKFANYLREFLTKSRDHYAQKKNI